MHTKSLPFLLPVPLLLVMASASIAAPDTTPPSVTPVNIPKAVTATGGKTDIVLDITDASGVNTDTVRLDILKPDGTSLLGGPQPMISFSSTINRWGYQVNLPANTGKTDAKYQILVSAADNLGNSHKPAFTVGTITIPKT